MFSTFDATDPAVALISWILTFVMGQLFTRFPKLTKFRHLLPVIAILIAVGAQAVISEFQGVDITGATVLRALGAGAVAIAAHSQVRELHKLLTSTPSDKGGEEEEGESTEAVAGPEEEPVVLTPVKRLNPAAML